MEVCHARPMSVPRAICRRKKVQAPTSSSPAGEGLGVPASVSQVSRGTLTSVFYAGLLVYLEEAAVFWYLLRSQHLKVLMDLTFHSLPLNRWFLFFFLTPSSFDKCPGLPMSTALPMLCQWRHPVVAIALWLLVKTFVGKGTRPSRHSASCGQLPPWTRSCWDALCSADRFFFNHWS